jgi:hypothetical protein
LGKGNLGLLNKWPDPVQTGDKKPKQKTKKQTKNVNMWWGHLKTFFSRTTGPFLSRLGINHPWGIVQIKGSTLLQGEIKAKRVKIH